MLCDIYINGLLLYDLFSEPRIYKDYTKPTAAAGAKKKKKNMCPEMNQDMIRCQVKVKSKNKSSLNVKKTIYMLIGSQHLLSK